MTYAGTDNLESCSFSQAIKSFKCVGGNPFHDLKLNCTQGNIIRAVLPVKSDTSQVLCTPPRHNRSPLKGGSSDYQKSTKGGITALNCR